MVSSQLQFPELCPIGPIADHEQMKFIRPSSLQTPERAKQSRCVLVFRQPPNVKEKVSTWMNAKRAAYCFGSGSIGAEDFRVNTEAKDTHVVHAPVTQQAAQPI